MTLITSVAALILPMITLTPDPQNAPAPAGAATTQATAHGFLYRTLKLGTESYAYSIWVPPEYNEATAWPVILFLHGSGERGSDGLLQTEVGIGTAIRRNRGLAQAIVVMPQCRREKMWTGDMAEMALKCIEQTSREYNLDADRIYLTGLSLGGHGAWTIASKLSHRLAAVAPVCGFWTVPQAPLNPVQFKDEITKLAKLPIWAFHGKLDKAVPVERTRELVDAVRQAGGNIQYTEYADGEHGIWDRVYENPDFWKWLLAQRRVEKKD